MLCTAPSIAPADAAVHVSVNDSSSHPVERRRNGHVSSHNATAPIADQSNAVSTSATETVTADPAGSRCPTPSG